VHRDVPISILDKGNSIPQKLLDNISQPFFTTKSTGKGTGRYSCCLIILLAACGEISVETTEGEGSEFIIQLPLK
jgi:signal transduction histidine kinase